MGYHTSLSAKMRTHIFDDIGCKKGLFSEHFHSFTLSSEGPFTQGTELKGKEYALDKNTILPRIQDLLVYCCIDRLVRKC